MFHRAFIHVKLVNVVFICGNPDGSHAGGQAVVRGRGGGAPSLLADMLKGATSLSSYQGLEFYCLIQPVSVQALCELSPAAAIW